MGKCRMKRSKRRRCCCDRGTDAINWASVDASNCRHQFSSGSGASRVTFATWTIDVESRFTQDT